MADQEPQVPAARTRREVIKLLRDLDPESRPTFHGWPVDRLGLTELARAASTGDQDSQTTLDELYELRVVGDLSGDPQLADVDEQWHVNMELLPQLAQEMGRFADVLRVEETAQALSGRVLLALLDGEVHRDFAARAVMGYPVLEVDSALRETLSRVCSEGDEPLRLVAATLAYEEAEERYEHEAAEREAAEQAAVEERQAADEADARRRQAEEEIAAEARLRPIRRRDRALVGGAVILVVTVWPAAALGAVLSRLGPFRDSGILLMWRLDVAPPTLNFGYWATGAVAILTVACVALCIRRQLRPHRLAAAAIGTFAITAGVLALLLPSIRNSAWAGELSRLGPSHGSGPCTHSEGAAYVLKSGIRQPIAVGPAPACQLVTRFSHKRDRLIWQNRIPRIRIRNIHKFESTLVIGGTYGGTRTRAGVVKGGRLVAVALGPLTGRELWRKTCRSPRNGEHAIAFSTATRSRHLRPFVHLRCGGGRILRLNPLTGHGL